MIVEISNEIQTLIITDSLAASKFLSAFFLLRILNAASSVVSLTNALTTPNPEKFS